VVNNIEVYRNAIVRVAMVTGQCTKIRRERERRQDSTVSKMWGSGNGTDAGKVEPDLMISHCFNKVLTTRVPEKHPMLHSTQRTELRCTQVHLVEKVNATLFYDLGVCSVGKAT